MLYRRKDATLGRSLHLASSSFGRRVARVSPRRTPFRALCRGRSAVAYGKPLDPQAARTTAVGSARIGGGPTAHAGGRLAHRAGHRRHHRRGSLRAHGFGGRVLGGPLGHVWVHPGGRRLRLRGPLLRRAGVDDPHRRQRVHLLVRDHGRAGRVDHRLGPGARVRDRRRHRRHRLERVLQQAPQPVRHAASRSRSATRPSRPTWRPARTASSTCRRCSSCSC